MDIIQIDEIGADDFSAIDLAEEARLALNDGLDIECYRVRLEDEAQLVEVLLVPDANIAGIVWGGNAEWLDHCYSGRDGAEQAVTDYFEGQA